MRRLSRLSSGYGCNRDLSLTMRAAASFSKESQVGCRSGSLIHVCAKSQTGAVTRSKVSCPSVLVLTSPSIRGHTWRGKRARTAGCQPGNRAGLKKVWKSKAHRAVISVLLLCGMVPLWSLRFASTFHSEPSKSHRTRLRSPVRPDCGSGKTDGIQPFCRSSSTLHCKEVVRVRSNQGLQRRWRARPIRW